MWSNLLAAGLASLAAAAAIAQPVPVPATSLTIVAEGRVARPPDIAELSGGVVTSAATADAALRENATRMAAVVAATRAAGVAARDIQTMAVSLAPQYRYVDNQPPVLTGYQASNSIALRLRRLDDAGRLLDTLVRVGANQLSGPVFRVEDSDAALDEARAAAVATGRRRAQLYAVAAGLRIRRIAAITENSGAEPGPRPMAMRLASAEVADTPIAPGEVALRVTVTMVFDLE